jgi:hypothetical protein
LFDWDPGDQIPFEYYRAMIAHPRFAEAARAIGVSAAETGRRADPILRYICKDAGRYVAGLAAVWLDLSGGLTLPRLKEMCGRSGVLSPGRARSFLQYLQHVGYVEMVRPGRAATPAVYAPSASFRTAWVEQLRGPMAAAALIAPQAADLLDRLDDPDICATFLRLQGGCLFDSTTAAGFEGPMVDCFYSPLAGVQILSVLIAGGEDGRFPSRTPALLAINQFARAGRFAHAYQAGVAGRRRRRPADAPSRRGLCPGGAGGRGAALHLRRPADPPADSDRPDPAPAWPGGGEDRRDQKCSIVTVETFAYRRSAVCDSKLKGR